MRGRLSIGLVGLLSAAAVSLPSAAEAQTPDGLPTHGDLIPGGAEVGAENHQFVPGDGPAEVAPAGSNSTRECWIVFVDEQNVSRRATVAELQSAYDRLQASGGDKIPITRVCQDVGGGNPTATPGLWPPDGGEGFLVSPEALRDMARSRLWFPPPVGDMSPGLGAGTFAQLPTYYWVTNTEPAPMARAEAGPYWAEVTATAVSQAWFIEDALSGRGGGEEFSCPGPGVPFDPASGATAPPEACPPWEPLHSSAGQPTTHPITGEPCFEATVTITWEVTWETNAPGVEDGFLGTGTSASWACVVVQELQAVVSSDGDG